MERALLLTTLIATLTLHVSSWQNVYDYAAPVYKLPSYITPNHYRLWIVPQLGPDYTIKGKMSVTFTTTAGPLTDPIVDIYLHRSNSITVNEYSVQLVNATGNVTIGSITNDDEIGMLRVTTPKGLNYSTVYTLSFDYTGKLSREEDVGFYVGSYLDGSQLSFTEYLATNFKPYYARLAFPCFDEPQLRATFLVSVARREDQTAVFTTPLLNTSQPDPTINNMVWDTFQTTTAISVQSLSLFVSTMRPLQQSCAKVTMYAPKGVPSNVLPNSFCEIMSIFEQTLKTNYPLSMLNVIVLPAMRVKTDGGAGIIYLRQDFFMSRNQTNAARLQEVLFPPVRQVMKQFIGYSVTPAWWTDIWLSEGIANYMSYVALTRYFQDWKLPWHHTVNVRQTAMRLDTNAGPLVAKSIQLPDGVLTAYNDPLNLIKGSSLLTMIENGYAPTPVYPAIVDICSKSTTGLISTADFLNSLKNILIQNNDINISLTSGGTILDSWFYDSGYPLVKATRQSDGSIVLTQERFCGIQSQSCSKTSTTWTIPISYTWKSQQNFMVSQPTVWLGSGSLVIRDVPQNEWYMLNILSTGYYRVNYDEANWLELKNQAPVLNSSDDGLSALVNKAQLIDDMMALAAQSSVNYSFALNYVLFVREETSRFPWYSAVTAFDRLQTALYGRQGYEDFKKYMRYLVEHIYSGLGFDSLNEMISHDESLLRALIVPWACNMEVGDCMSRASSVANDFASGRDLTGIVSGNIIEAVMCAGFQYAGIAQMLKLYDLYKSAKPGSETNNLAVIGMGCSNSTQIRNTIFSELLKEANSNVKPGDAEKVLSIMYSRPESVDSVLDFITANAVRIQTLFGSTTLSRLVTGISTKLNSQAQVSKLNNMLATAGSSLDTTVTDTTTAAASIAKATADWLDNGAGTQLYTSLQTVNSEIQPASAASSLNVGITTLLVLAMCRVLLLN